MGQDYEIKKGAHGAAKGLLWENDLVAIFRIFPALENLTPSFLFVFFALETM